MVGHYELREGIVPAKDHMTAVLPALDKADFGRSLRALSAGEAGK